jgi:hypothetical protein
MFKDAHSLDLFGGLLATNIIFCVFIIPLIAAGSSIAEERGLGVMGWQQMQPVSRLRQWLVKMAVLVATVFLLSVALPTLVLFVGHALFPFSVPHILDAGWFGSLIFLLGGLLLLGIVVFASSASRSTFRAILLAMLLLGACGTAVFLPMRASAATQVRHEATGTVIFLIAAAGLVYFQSYRLYRAGEPGAFQTFGRAALIVLAFGLWGVFYSGML